MIRIASVLAACVCVMLPLSAEAGQRHGPTHWRTAPNGQGVIRVYGADTQAPPVYHGGNFHGGLRVQTGETYSAPDARYGRPEECRSTCVVTPPPQRVAEGVACHNTHHGRHAVAHETYAYERQNRYDEAYGEPVYRETTYERHHGGPDCACRHGSHARYNAPHDGYGDDRYYDERYHDEPYHEDRYAGRPYRDRYSDDYRGRDVFGRY